MEVRSHLIDDTVLVRLKSVLTPVEIRLVETEDRARAETLSNKCEWSCWSWDGLYWRVLFRN